MDEELRNESMIPFITEIGTYILIALVILLVAPSFIIYPGIYYGRWKSTGPIFNLETRDKANIEGMILEPADPKICNITILFFHENSGNMGSRMEFLKDLNKTHNAYVLSIDYRGFGNNYGFPSETGLINDAESVLECVMNDDRLKNTKKIMS